MSGAKNDDTFSRLLASMSREMLTALVEKMVRSRPELRAECLLYLGEAAVLTEDQRAAVDNETVLSLWASLSPDLEDLESYGGGDYALADRVEGLLSQVETVLSRKTAGRSQRREILKETLEYIGGNNTGVQDSLYDLADA